MKYFTLFILLFAFYQASGQEDYTIKINDQSLKIALDKKYEIEVNGKKVAFQVSANDTLTFQDNIVSFLYPKGFNVSRTQISEGIEQLMIMGADGSGLIIQRYANFNPTGLNEMMINEVTKESVNYGYNLKRKDYKKTLKSGQKFEVTKAILNYKDQVNTYEIISIGKKDEGILILTMNINNEKDSPGQKLIDLMWSTLVLN